ncbi:MAG: YncE family protein [Thermodesulfovibrionales bacterium]
MNLRNSENWANKVNRVNNVSSWLFALCYFLIFLAGCASVSEQAHIIDYPSQNAGQLTLYLNGPDKATLDIKFELSAVSIMAENGSYREVMSKPINISSIKMQGRQMLIAETYLPEGKYIKLKFNLKEAIIYRKDRMANLSLPPDGVEIPLNITINRNQNTTLFLRWDADASVIEGYQFNPALTVKTTRPELSTLLIYVTNEDSHNVSVINRQTDEVVSTILVGKKPRGIATGMRRQHLRIYVANSGSNSVSVIDPTTNKVETEIPIRFGRQPEGIAVATISPEREYIFVTNYGSNTLSVIDALTYQETEKINVGNGPIAVEVDPPVESLLSSKFLSFDSLNILKNYRDRFFNVYVANKNSKEVTVLRFDSSTGRFMDSINLNVEWNPIALEVDYQRGKVYVANYGFDNLSVIDIIELIKGNTISAVNNISGVGHSNTGVVSDPSLERIYLLKETPGEILIIRPSFEDQSPIKTVIPVISTIPVGASPRSMKLDPEIRKLYVVNRGSDNVSVIDKTTRKEEKVIPVGKKPYGITMIPY